MKISLFVVFILFNVSLSWSQKKVDPKDYFPIRYVNDTLLNSKKSFRNNLYKKFEYKKITDKTLPFHMTNYVNDTIWGYYVITNPYTVQEKGFTIVVNEMGHTKRYKMLTNEVDYFSFYIGRDTLNYKGILLKNEVLKNLTSEKKYLLSGKDLSADSREDAGKFFLLHELESGYINLYEYSPDAKSHKKIYLFIYRNKLMLFDYKAFVDIGFISTAITEKKFNKVHPKWWTESFNQHLAWYYKALRNSE